VLTAGRIVAEETTQSIDRHWLAEKVYLSPEEVAA
jgi:hypothetical protein